MSLLNYKNFESHSFEFDSKINCFVGPNGIGKTNILDAIYHLSFGKSYFNPVSSQNIKHNEDFFVIDGTYTINNMVFNKGSYQRIPANEEHGTFSSENGATLLVSWDPIPED